MAPKIQPNADRRRALPHTKQDQKVSSYRKGRPFNNNSKLAELMTKLRISQQELSLRSTIHTRTLYEYMTGHQPIPAHHIRQIEVALNLPAREFYESAEELYQRGSLKMTPAMVTRFRNVPRDVTDEQVQAQKTIPQQMAELPSTISSNRKAV